MFQRTPNFSMPGAQPAARSRAPAARSRRKYAEQRRRPASRSAACRARIPRRCAALGARGDARGARRARTRQGWETGGIGGILLAFNDLIAEREANETAAEFVREKIREIGQRPRGRREALPDDHPIGTKRICVDTDYFETYNRDNVDARRRPRRPDRGDHPDAASQTSDAEYELDVIVFATGFDAMTGALLDIDIRGRERPAAAGEVGERAAHLPRPHDRRLPEPVPRHRPGQPVRAEQHGPSRSSSTSSGSPTAIGHLRRHGLEAIEATPDAEDAWVEHVDEVAQATLFPRANSWYVGANIPGKPRVFMPYLGGVGAYRAQLRRRSPPTAMRGSP